VNIIDALLGEHGALYFEMDCLEQALQDARAHARALAALVGTAIERHSRLEDELLFSVLVRQSTEAEGIVRSMQRLHEYIIDTLAQIRALPDGPNARDLALNATSLAREHFSAEEELCFPLAGEVLSEPVLSRLGARWAERRASRTCEPADDSLPRGDDLLRRQGPKLPHIEPGAYREAQCLLASGGYTRWRPPASTQCSPRGGLGPTDDDVFGDVDGPRSTGDASDAGCALSGARTDRGAGRAAARKTRGH
jgi:hemerythrin-like domain-containing protein